MFFYKHIFYSPVGSVGASVLCTEVSTGHPHPRRAHDIFKEIENLNILKSEVVKAIKGESSFSADMLSALINESEKRCDRVMALCRAAEKDVNDTEIILKDLSDSFDELITWSELYDEASFEKKKMIVNCLIKWVDVCRDYKLKIDFNIDFEQFMVGIDKVA